MIRAQPDVVLPLRPVPEHVQQPVAALQQRDDGPPRVVSLRQGVSPRFPTAGAQLPAAVIPAQLLQSPQLLRVAALQPWPSAALLLIRTGVVLVHQPPASVFLAREADEILRHGDALQPPGGRVLLQLVAPLLRPVEREWLLRRVVVPPGVGLPLQPSASFPAQLE